MLVNGTNEAKASTPAPNGLVALENHKADAGRKPGKYEWLRIYKNIIVIGLAFMVQFTAFYGTINLQSSVNISAGLGTSTLAVMYVSIIVSNMLIPTMVIRWLGCKWTIALGLIVYMPYIAAQFYPSFYTFIPSAIAVGLGAGPLWCAKCTYLSLAADAMNSLRSSTNSKGGSSTSTTGGDVTVIRFFGLFFVFYQMAQVWGNLISSSVLSSKLFSTIPEAEPLGNFTAITLALSSNLEVNHVDEICGAKFCPGVSADVNPNLTPPEPIKIQLLSGIFLVCMAVASLLVMFGVDSSKRYQSKKDNDKKEPSACQLLLITLKQLSEKYQLLILPITMFIGAEEAFVTVDFTAAFVACGWGISKIGFAMICFGAANAVAAAVAGILVNLVGRVAIIMVTFVLHGTLLIWMHEWVAVSNDYLTYCAMAALWGIADGLWLVIINAFYGILFPGKETAAYSNFRLWESTGSVITYAISPFLCTSYKLRALIGLMIIGFFGYITIEVLQKRKLKKSTESDLDKSGRDDTNTIDTIM